MNKYVMPWVVLKLCKAGLWELWLVLQGWMHPCPSFPAPTEMGRWHCEAAARDLKKKKAPESRKKNHHPFAICSLPLHTQLHIPSPHSPSTMFTATTIPVVLDCPGNRGSSRAIPAPLELGCVGSQAQLKTLALTGEKRFSPPCAYSWACRETHSRNQERRKNLPIAAAASD